MNNSLKLNMILAGVWLWTHITNLISKMVLKYVQLSVFLTLQLSLPVITLGRWSYDKNRRKIDVLKAYSISHDHQQDITQQFNLFLNWYWDNEIGDGGIDVFQLEQVFSFISNLCYLSKKYSISKIFIVFLHDAHSLLPSNITDYINKIQFMTINIKENDISVNQTMLNNMSDMHTQQDEILFNQIPLLGYEIVN